MPVRRHLLIQAGRQSTPSHLCTQLKPRRERQNAAQLGANEAANNYMVREKTTATAEEEEESQLILLICHSTPGILFLRTPAANL